MANGLPDHQDHLLLVSLTYDACDAIGESLLHCPSLGTLERGELSVDFSQLRLTRLRFFGRRREGRPFIRR